MNQNYCQLLVGLLNLEWRCFVSFTTPLSSALDRGLSCYNKIYYNEIQVIYVA